jgi:superfamily II DNA or RNA helicase
MSINKPIEVFSTTEGRALVKSIVLPLVDFEPHDPQIEGVCKVLDGCDLLVILPTGYGKTGFLFLYMLALNAIRTDERVHTKVRTRIPEKAAMVVIVPTNAVGVQMVRKPSYNAA